MIGTEPLKWELNKNTMFQAANSLYFTEDKQPSFLLVSVITIICNVLFCRIYNNVVSFIKLVIDVEKGDFSED